MDEIEVKIKIIRRSIEMYQNRLERDIIIGPSENTDHHKELLAEELENLEEYKKKYPEYFV